MTESIGNTMLPISLQIFMGIGNMKGFVPKTVRVGNSPCSDQNEAGKINFWQNYLPRLVDSKQDQKQSESFALSQFDDII